MIKTPEIFRKHITQNPMQYLKYTLTILAAAVAIILCILLLATGAGFLISIGTVLIVAIAIYFGALREFAGSVILTFLFVTLKTELHTITSIWWPGPNTQKFFTTLDSIGYAKLFLLVFFVAYGISFLTSRFKLFHCTVENKIEAPPKAEDGDKNDIGDILKNARLKN